MASRRETLWEVGTRGTPFAVYKLTLQNEPYPEGGLNGFRHFHHAPVLVLADTGTLPGLIYRYDYEENRIRIYQFDSHIGEVSEMPIGQELSVTVRFFVVYNWVGRSS